MKDPKPQTTLPTQKPITDEPAPKAPSRWKPIIRRVLLIIAVIVALALVYVFLLLGEPSEDSELAKQQTAVEETIRVPMAGIQMQSDAELNVLAANFGKPILAMSGEGLTFTEATLTDTAFEGGYARRVRMTYTMSDGRRLVAESIRPTAAVKLLGGGYSLRVGTLYTLCGLDAARMDSAAETCVFASSADAVYAIVCPTTDTIGALLKQAVLLQPSTPQ